MGQAWHLVTSTFTCVAGVAWRGTWRHRPSLFVAGGLALVVCYVPVCRCGSVCGRRGELHCLWQAWHLVTSTFTCVAGVALGDIDLHFHFVWQAWHWAGSGDALGRSWPAVTPQSFVWICVAGVALGDIDLHFVWQAALTELGWLWRRAWSRPARDAAVFCVAGVALGDIGNSLIRTSFTQSAVHSPRNSHTLSHNLLTHTTSHNLLTRNSLTCKSLIRTCFTQSAFRHLLPIPASPFFRGLLEEVDMWRYPVL